MQDRLLRVAILCCAALAAAGAIAQAQTYPSKPIRMVIAWPAGGPTDTVGRIVGQEMTRTWGQQVIVENRPGASGTIGADVVAKAAPNGYTILMAYTPEITITQSLFKSLPYDPVKDLAPVILVATTPMMLVVHPSLPARNVKELVALARSRPGQLAYASAGNGSPPHLAGELFKSMAGVDLVHVPYKGATPALADLLGGHVVMYFTGMLAAMPHVKAGKLRALAVSTARRSLATPEIPAVAESGMRDFDISTWYGVLAPAGTPRDIVGKLNAEIFRVLTLTAVTQQLAREGVETAPNSPEQFGKFIRSEIAKFAKIIKESGARAE